MCDCRSVQPRNIGLPVKLETQTIFFNLQRSFDMFVRQRVDCGFYHAALFSQLPQCVLYFTQRDRRNQVLRNFYFKVKSEGDDGE